MTSVFAVVGRLRALAVVTALAGAASVAVEGFEPAPSLKASDLLPASLLKGPKHEVAPGR